MSNGGPTSDASSAAEAFFGALHRAAWDEAAAMVDLAEMEFGSHPSDG
jgi:hypothetical protein